MAEPDRPADAAPQVPTPNGAAAGAEPRQSLREIAEAAFDELTAEDGGEPEGEPSSQITQPRDNFGRFVPKDQEAKPGEAAAPEGAPQPREDQGQKPAEHPAPETGEAAQPPANWSAADRETFSKLTPEGQAFLLRRHSDMEGDYQRRVQANTRAAEFTNALAPVFTDPVLAGSLQQNRMSPYDAITEWAGFHRRAISPNPNERVHLLFELANRMQIDPAVFAQSRSGPPAPGALSEQDLADPAIRFFADHIGRTSSEVQAVRAELQGMRQATANQQNAEALKVTRWSIDTFADEKGPDGKLLRPDFDLVLDQIIELMKGNPDRDIREAYETARWMNAQTRQTLIQAERQRVEQAEANRRASLAVRSNVRGLTSPVTKPADKGDGKGLRATIEEAADEIGF